MPAALGSLSPIGIPYQIQESAMATAIDTQTDLEEFHRWLGERLKNGKPAFTLKESVAEFLAWKNERERLREALQPALERSRRGESLPWNKEAIWAEARRRLAAKGIRLDET